MMVTKNRMKTLNRVIVTVAVMTALASKMIKNCMSLTRTILTKKRIARMISNADTVEERFITEVSDETTKILSTKGWRINAAHVTSK